MVSRFIEKQLLAGLRGGKVIGLLGARRVGKTVLMKKIKDALAKKKVLMVYGENLDAIEALSSQRLNVLERLIKGYDHLFIDEAQGIPNIGQNLKLLVDNFPKLSIFVTGSSSFDLKSKIGEPLVGRSLFLHLYPFAQLELQAEGDYLSNKEKLEERLIYGSYPQVVTAKSIKEKIEQLEAIRDGYLLKDILALDNIKNSLFIFNLLRLLAFQIGQDVSFSELASNLNVNKKTVMRYLELLEKTFVIFSLQGFSKNLRKEYTKSPRFYFCDNGIRNVIISNFNHLNLRDDVGKLWENYCMVERIKKTSYENRHCNRYFWRTYDQKEIDLIEEKNGKLYGFEFKWGKGKVKTPKAFIEAYPGSLYRVINQENYLNFIT